MLGVIYKWEYPLNFFFFYPKEKTVIENAVEPERNPENEKRLIEMQTFLLAYLTAKVSQSSCVSDMLKTALLNQFTIRFQIQHCHLSSF